MAITKATMLTDSWNTVYNHLQTGTYAITTNNIFSSYNSQLAKTTGYPIVIISPPSSDFQKLDVQGQKTNSNLVFNIEVYHNSSQNVKTVTDEVINKLLTGRTVFSGNRLMNMKLEQMDYDTWEDGGKKKHRLSFNVSFRYIA